MSRPKKATVDYFPHSVNHKKTIFILEQEYQNDGYSFWFKLLEMLGSTENHFIDCNERTTWRFFLAKTFFDEEKAIEILNLLAEIEAIDFELWQKKIIWSENFVKNLETLYNKRDLEPYGKQEILDKCMNKSQTVSLIATETPKSETNTDINPQSKLKESKVKESKEEIDIFFENIWELYPKKLGKSSISKSKKKELFKIGYNKLSKAIENYKKSTYGTEKKFLKHGSSFFNTNYVDYLEENFDDSLSIKKKNSNIVTDEKYSGIENSGYDIADIPEPTEEEDLIKRIAVAKKAIKELERKPNLSKLEKLKLDKYKEILPELEKEYDKLKEGEL